MRAAAAAVLAGLAISLAAACSTAPVGADPERESGDDGGDGALTVFAAASLRDVLAELEPRWESAHPLSPLAIAFDASNILAAQIAEGAPVDVFISADTERPESLAARGLTAAAPVTFARNRITLVVPLESGAVRSVEDLADPGVRLVAAGDGVPITAYAEAALRQWADTTPDAAAFLAGVAANIASREDNVRAALAKVELGEGDAALVYASDARSSTLVREVPLPPGVDVTAEYAAVQVSDRPQAAELLDWLSGPQAAAALAEAGFEPAVG